LLERLIRGERAKVDLRTAKEASLRQYQQLPEMQEKARAEAKRA
jgi:hypothetical protein